MEESESERGMFTGVLMSHTKWMFFLSFLFFFFLFSFGIQIGECFIGCKSVYCLGFAVLEWVLWTCSHAVNQVWLKLFGAYMQFSWNSRHIVLKKKKCLRGFQTAYGFCHSEEMKTASPTSKCIISWIVLFCCMLPSSRIWLTSSLESGCFCHRFCLNTWSLDSADCWATQRPKLKASRRLV